MVAEEGSTELHYLYDITQYYFQPPHKYPHQYPQYGTFAIN